MQLVRWAVALSVLAVVGIPAIQAQAAPAEGVLYFTNKLVADNTVNGASSGGPKIFDTTQVAPTSATDQKAYSNVGTGALALETAFQWKATEAFKLTGKVTAHFWVACDVATVYRAAEAATYRLTFQKNGGTISTTSVTDATPTACTGPTSIREITVQADTADTAWKAGDVIAASFGFWMESPPETAAKNFHFLVGSKAHPSQFHAAGLPIPGGASGPAAPKIVNETLNGTSALVDHTFGNVSSDTYRYNWTSDLANVTVSANASISNGSLMVRVVAPGGNESFNHTFTANDTQGTRTTNVTGAKNGTWVIELRLTNLTGRVHVAIQEAVAAVPSASNMTSAAPTNTTSTSGAAAKSKSGIPAPGEAAVVVAVLAAAFVRRRRD